MKLQTRKVERSIFLILCFMGFFAILSSTMSKTLLNPFAKLLQVPTDWSGFVGAASTIPGILVSLPAASLSDVYGRRKFLLLASLVFATAPIFYLFITSWWQLILVRFYHGFATAIFVPVAEASMAELYPTKRGERISLFTSATYFGRGVAPFLGGYILFTTNTISNPLYNYHLMYVAVAAMGLVAFVTALVFLAEKKPAVVSVQRGRKTLRELYVGWGALAKDRDVLAVSFVQACVYYSYGTVDYFLSGYLKDHLNFDFFSTAAVSGGLIVLAIFVRSYMGRLSDRTGRRKPIIMGLIISAIPLLAIPYFSDFPTLLLLALIYGFGFATTTASTSPLIAELAPADFVGTSMGFLDTVMDVGQTIGPIMSGFVLATVFQYYGVFWPLSLILLAASLIFALSKTGKSRKTNSSKD
jgi:MFS family permease